MTNTLSEITVTVDAEAAQEYADQAEEAETTLPDVGRGRGRDSGRGGRGAGLRGGLVGLVLGPLIGVFEVVFAPMINNVLKPILTVLQAFLAPVSSMLLRQLTPVLRLLTRILPAWLAFTDDLPDMIDDVGREIESLPQRLWDFMKALPDMMWSVVESSAGWITNGAEAIGKAVWSVMSSGVAWLTDGIETIATAIANAIFDAFAGGIDWLTDLPKRLWALFSELPGDVAEAISERVVGSDTPVPDIDLPRLTDVVDTDTEPPLPSGTIADSSTTRVNLALTGTLGAVTDTERIQLEPN